MLSDIACSALRSGKVLELRYDGFSRSVEVHAVGFSKEGYKLMRVWQIRGGSDSGEPIGWKLMRLDEVRAANISDENSLAPRVGYRKNDRAMTRIICQL